MLSWQVPGARRILIDPLDLCLKQCTELRGIRQFSEGGERYTLGVGPSFNCVGLETDQTAGNGPAVANHQRVGDIGRQAKSSFNRFRVNRRPVE